MIGHINPTDDSRRARAPYNFVPLPLKVFTVKDGIDVRGQPVKPWLKHDQFVPDTNSGWVDLTIQTLTPLFIRGPVTRRAGGTWDEREARLRPEPFMTPDRRPAIPGSSLRGMIRNLVEILSFSKIAPVTGERPFFRTVARDRVGLAYRDLLVRGNSKPSGGFARRNQDGSWSIEPAREVLRVSHDALPGLRYSLRPDYLPRWDLQHRQCWLQRRDKSDHVAKLSVDQNPPSGAGWVKGTLVLTGSAPKKKAEFVFLEPRPDERIPIPGLILKRFHDDDQITNWQEKAFPRDRPTARARKARGHLRDGEPVFFVRDDAQIDADNPNGLVFFGRAQMFRFPYDRSPQDLIPEELHNAGIDLTEAMFGVLGEDLEGTIKGRLRFEDAVANGQGPWLEEILVPKILSAPKITAFQHYLTQDGRVSREDLTTFLDGDRTTLRGHKHYWHRWDDSRGLDEIRHEQHGEKLADLRSTQPKDTQCTLIKPVKIGVQFSGRVRFENLTDLELGALLSALQLPDGCHHKIGMGKPLGLGSISVDVKLSLVDREARYRGWGDLGLKEGVPIGPFKDTFADAIAAHADDAGEARVERASGLQGIARLNALFQMLSWAHRPPLDDTRQMSIKNADSENEYLERRVLPTPHAVARQPEPRWNLDGPKTRGATADSLPREQVPRQNAFGPQAPARQARGPGGPQSKSPGFMKPSPVKSSSTEFSRASFSARPRNGASVRCVVLPEKSNKGKWRFRVKDQDVSGVLHPKSPIPPDDVLVIGKELDLIVATEGATDSYQFRWVDPAAAPPASTPTQRTERRGHGKSRR